jgi:ABC-type Mn2+/Zn2+ transport system permease subunit
VRKYLAPIVIVFLVLSWIVFQGFSLLFFSEQVGTQIPVTVKIIGLGFVTLFSVAIITVLIQRMKEIKEDDKDDLSQY